MRIPLPVGRSASAVSPTHTYSPEQAQALAERWLRDAYRNPLRTQILELVAEYGTLTGDQLHALARREMRVTEKFVNFERTLYFLCEDDLLKPLPRLAALLLGSGVQRPAWKHAKRPDTRLRGYTLGVVGERLAGPLLHALNRNPRAANVSRAPLHDALAAEVLWHLSADDAERVPVAPGAAALWDDERNCFFYRPDGLLLRQMDGEWVDGYLLELCNEVWTSPERAEKKLRLYADLLLSERWREWGLTSHPSLLVVYRAPETAQIFAAKAHVMLSPKAEVYGAALTDVLSGHTALRRLGLGKP